MDLGPSVKDEGSRLFEVSDLALGLVGFQVGRVRRVCRGSRVYGSLTIQAVGVADICCGLRGQGLGRI